MELESDWQQFFRRSLTDLETAHRRRLRQLTKHLPLQMIERQGRFVINFGGNDYLGLRSDPRIIAAAMKALSECGVGSGASPSVTGFQESQQLLQRRLATFVDLPDALVFSSGFAGNLATISSLAGEGDVIYSDAFNHASLIDGCRLSKAARFVFPHADVAVLADQLKATRKQFHRAIIVTESIFSMDGDAAPLLALSELAKDYDVGLIVDEAHATGVYGATGAGLLEELALSHQVLAKLGTLSKAVGCLGGFVAGSNLLVEYILNRGRSYMFSTALPASILSAAQVAVELLIERVAERQLLRRTAIATRQRLASDGWQVLGSDSPIIPLVVGSESAALELSGRLLECGIYVPAIRPPTVPVGACRLRVSLSCEHSQTQLDQLCDALRHCKEINHHISRDVSESVPQRSTFRR